MKNKWGGGGGEGGGIKVLKEYFTQKKRINFIKNSLDLIHN